MVTITVDLNDITSPYATLGHPKPAPIKVTADIEMSSTGTSDDPRAESPGYASLGEQMTSSDSERTGNSSVNGKGPESPKYIRKSGNKPPPLSLDMNGEPQYINSRRSLTGSDTSHYATLGGARPKTDENQNGGVRLTSPKPPVTPPLNHGYVNVRSHKHDTRTPQEFYHPAPPPPESPLMTDRQNRTELFV